jgi:hypothetical protein
VSAVLRFAGQARWSGAADTYRVARRELDARDLGCLLPHLRRVDPDWRAPLKERRAFAGVLLEAGVRDSKILDQTGISRTTLWRIRQQVAEGACKPASEWAAGVSNGATLTRRSSGPILCCEASSGKGDLEAIRRPLAGAA